MGNRFSRVGIARSEIAASNVSRASSSSRIVKVGESPSRDPNRRNRRLPTEWKVPPMSRRVSTERSASTRRSISRAALLVNVRSMIREGSVPDSISRATR